MSPDETLSRLLDPELRELVQQHLQADPAQLALRLQHPLRREVAEQVKYLQRARAKLPAFYAAGCVLTPLGYEQCSSEQAALAKAAAFSGERCLDLTFGTGVDTWALAGNFSEVVALETDAVRAALGGHNLRLLGRANVQVLHTAAEDFLAHYNGPPFDLIYADPARRDAANHKTVRLQDCAPDVLGLMSLLLKHGRQVLLKLSPLFDVDAVWQALPQAAEVTVVSLENECKEVLVRIAQAPAQRGVRIMRLRSAGVQTFDFLLPYNTPALSLPEEDFPYNVRYVCEPDVAFYKARLVQVAWQKLLPNAALFHPESYLFAYEKPTDFPGRVLAVENVFPYKPDKITAELRVRSLTQVNVSRRYFMVSPEEILKQLRMRTVGDYSLCCTTIGDAHWAFLGKWTPVTG